MTTNKRFKNVEENLEWGTVQYFTYHDEKITDKEIEKLVNHLLNQNEQLKNEIEKIAYANEDLLKEKRQWKKLSDEYAKLYEENEQLKSKNRGLQSELQIFKEDVTHSNLQINKLADENEQLKQQEKRLYKYFRKCFDNVSEQGFRETWEVVKKYD